MNRLVIFCIWASAVASLSVIGDVLPSEGSSIESEQLYGAAANPLHKFMAEKGWREGWHPQSGRFFVVSQAEFEVSNPAQDIGFLQKRNIYYRIALLRAKAQIIEFMNTRVVATEQLAVDFHAEFQKYGEIRTRMENVAAKILENIGVVDVPRGMGPNELHRRITNEIEHRQLAEPVQRQVENFMAAYKQLAVLEQKLELDRPHTVKRLQSDIETLAVQPLYGMATLNQVEAWTEDTQRYQLAVLVVWSPILEYQAKCIIEKRQLPEVAALGRGDVYSFLDNLDLRIAVGGRQFVDDQGQRWFLGIGTAPLPQQADGLAAQRMAQMQATANIAFSLFADVEAWKLARSLLEEKHTLQGLATTEITESFAERLAQQVSRPISGIMPLTEKKVIHPISGQAMVVVVSAINMQAATAAVGILGQASSALSPSVKTTDAPRTPEATYEFMVTNGLKICQGTHPNDGSYMVIVCALPKDISKDNREVAALARIAARRELAAFLEQRLHAAETATSNNDESFFNILIRSDVDMVLTKARLLDIANREDTIYCGYVLSEKSFGGGQSDAQLTAVENAPPTALNSPGASNLVYAIGIAMVVGVRVDEARENALNVARRDAVEQVLGTMIAATTQVQNLDLIREKIYANAIGFVDSYRVVGEEQLKETYRIEIEASVSRNRMFECYSAMLKTMSDPQFFIDSRDDEELYQRFSDFFAELGFKITTVRSDASYIIQLQGKFSPVKHPANKREGTQLSLWVQMVDPNTQQMLFTLKNDPRQAAVFIGDESRQHDLCVNMAFQQMRTPLHEKINAIIVKMAQSGRTVRLRFQGISDTLANHVPDIARIVEDFPGVFSSSYRMDMTNMFLDFNLTYAGRTETLSELLLNSMRQQLPATFQPTLNSITPNEIILNLKMN